MIAKEHQIIPDHVCRWDDGYTAFYFDYPSDGYRLKAKLKRQVEHCRNGFVPRENAEENRLPFQFMVRDFFGEFKRDIDIYYRMPCI